FGAGGNDQETRFPGGRSREVKLRPDQPSMDTLIFRERGVGGLNRSRQSGAVSVIRQEDRARLGVAAAFQGNDHAIAHRRLFAERRFQVLGINVEPCGSDDDTFLASTKTQVSFLVDFTQISSWQPALLAGRLEGAGLPVTCGHVFTPNKNLAVVSELAFAARKNLAYRAGRGPKGMIQADQRCGFRHAIALNDGVAHSLEEVFGRWRKGRSAGNKCPEPPAKASMNAAEHPRAPQKLPASRPLKPALEEPRFRPTFKIPFDGGMKQIEHSWHGNE